MSDCKIQPYSVIPKYLLLLSPLSLLVLPSRKLHNCIILFFPFCLPGSHRHLLHGFNSVSRGLKRLKKCWAWNILETEVEKSYIAWCSDSELCACVIFVDSQSPLVEVTELWCERWQSSLHRIRERHSGNQSVQRPRRQKCKNIP